MKLISVIVPVYKAERYLGECVDSILNQTYESFELILVDDGSPDNSGKICDEYAKKDERVKVIHKENGGVSSARNTGIDNAKGEYITFVDSDDVVDRQYLELMYKRIKETKSDMCFCHFDRFDEEVYVEYKETIPEFLTIDFDDEKFINFANSFFNLKKNVFGSACRILFKKPIVNMLRFNTKIKISEDLVFTLNAIFNSRSICSIQNVLYHYRTNFASVGQTYKKNFLTSQLELQKELELIFARFNGRTAKKISELYFCLICYYLFSNELKFRKINSDYKKNLNHIRKSELYSYFKFKNILKLGDGTIKQKMKHSIIWFLAKTRIWG